MSSPSTRTHPDIELGSRLQEFRKDIYSQTGEDGVIEKILETLPSTDGWCVEFGAWDGNHLSNTRNLIESREYSAILIEGDTRRFKDLEKTSSKNDNIIAINAFVGFGESDNLDSILEATPIPKDFDFLSIDIDGNDYHVWAAVKKFAPKLVCIEFNPTVPNEVNFIQPADPHIFQGCSLSALCVLAAEKGYELVCALSFNAFFVRREYFPAFDIKDNRPEVLRTDLSQVTYLFSCVDGSVHMAGYGNLPWHSVEIRASDLQVLPSMLREHPGNYSRVQWIWLKLLRRLRGGG